MDKVMYKRIGAENASIWEQELYWNPSAGKVLCGAEDTYSCGIQLGEIHNVTPEVATALAATNPDRPWYEEILDSDSAAEAAGCSAPSWCDTSDWNEDELERFFNESWSEALEKGQWYICLDTAYCSEEQLEDAMNLAEVVAKSSTGDGADPVFRGIGGKTAALEVCQLKEAALLLRRLEAQEWFYGRVCDLCEGAPADLVNKVAGEAAVIWCESSDMPARNELTDQLDAVLDRALELRDGNGTAYADRLATR